MSPLMILLACAGSGPKAADDGPAADTSDSAYVDPPVDIDQLELDLATLMNMMRTLRAMPVLDSFVAAMAYAEDGCPNDTTISDPDYGTSTFFQQLCQTSDDVVFKGPANYWVWEEQLADANEGGLSFLIDEDPTLRWTGAAFNGQTDIYDLAGTFDFNCSCNMMDAWAVGDDGSTHFKSYTSGTSHWTGAEAVGSYMDDPAIVPDLTLDFIQSPTNVTVITSGTVTGYADRYGTAGLSLVFNSARGETPTCLGAEAGTIKVRDAESVQWISFYASFTENCLACGEIETGETVCVDLSPLIDWESTPW